MKFVTVNVGRIEGFRHAIRTEMIGDDNAGPIRTAMHQWGVRYRSFLQRRFLAFSRGGGDWPPLAASTIRARRSTAKTKLQRAKKSYRSAAARLEKSLKSLRRSGSQAANVRAEKAQRNFREKERAMLAATRDRKQQVETGEGIAILRDTGLLFMALTPELVGAEGQYQLDVEDGVMVGFGGPGTYPDGKATIADIASFHQAGGGRLPQRRIVVPPDEQTVAAMQEDMRRAIRRLLGGGI